MNFEWTFRAGDVLTCIGGFAVAAAFLYKRGGSDVELKIAVAACLKEISEMKAELSEFGKAITRLAVQETKVNLLMKWYDELRRGKGWVQGHEVDTIDGEYK
jgi:hypothetical protein